MSRPQYGSALADGKVRYFSPSALTAGDPEGDGGCPRSYWYAYVAKFRRPSTKAQETGTALHAELETYLKTGVKNLGSLALSGLHMLPTPGPDLLIEHDIAGGSLDTAPLRIRDVPIMGYIDLVHARGCNAGVADVEDTYDPPGTIEVFDHKTTSDVKYIKTPLEMSRTIQMTTYGKWVLAVAPETPWVRLSHGYFITKGRHTPRKVTLRVLPETIEKQWEHVERVAATLIDVAAETNPDLVPANTRSCGAFGGCFHKSYCKAAMHNSLAGFIGADAAASFFKSSQPTSPSTQTSGVPDMASPLSLINRLNAAKNATPPAVTATGNLNPFAAASSPAPAPTPIAPPIDPTVEMARLAKQEITTKYPDLEIAVASMETYGRDIGIPALAGEAARAVAMLRGFAYKPGDSASGTGEMGQYMLDTVEQLLAAPGQMQEIVKSRAEIKEMITNPPISNALLSPETPEPTVSAAVVAPVIAAAPVEAEVPALKRSRGRPKKSAEAVVTDAAASAIAMAVEMTAHFGAVAGDHQIVMYTPEVATTPTPMAPATTMTPVTPAMPVAPPAPQVVVPLSPVPIVAAPPRHEMNSDDAIYFYVDAIPSCYHEDFWVLVDHFVAVMNEASGADDFRNADPKTTRGAAFCFGAWKGALATMLRATPIVGGHYVLDGASSEIASVVIDTMRPIVAASGGCMIRGTR